MEFILLVFIYLYLYIDICEGTVLLEVLTASHIKKMIQHFRWRGGIGPRDWGWEQERSGVEEGN